MDHKVNTKKYVIFCDNPHTHTIHTQFSLSVLILDDNLTNTSRIAVPLNFFFSSVISAFFFVCCLVWVAVDGDNIFICLLSDPCSICSRSLGCVCIKESCPLTRSVNRTHNSYHIFFFFFIRTNDL